MLTDQRQLLRLVRAAIPQPILDQVAGSSFDPALALQGLNKLLGTNITIWDGDNQFPEIWQDAIFIINNTSDAALVLPYATAHGDWTGTAVMGQGSYPQLPHGIIKRFKTAPLGPADIFAYFLRVYLKSATQRRVERLSPESLREMRHLLMALGVHQLSPVIQAKLQAWMVRLLKDCELLCKRSNSVVSHLCLVLLQRACDSHPGNSHRFLDRVLDRAQSEVPEDQISILQTIGVSLRLLPCSVV